MASKRHIRRKSCGSKIKFSTVGEAKAKIHTLSVLGKAKGHLNVYRCKFCKKYHIGHAPYWNTNIQNGV